MRMKGRRTTTKMRDAFQGRLCLPKRVGNVSQPGEDPEGPEGRESEMQTVSQGAGGWWWRDRQTGRQRVCPA